MNCPTCGSETRVTGHPYISKAGVVYTYRDCKSCEARLRIADSGEVSIIPRKKNRPKAETEEERKKRLNEASDAWRKRNLDYVKARDAERQRNNREKMQRVRPPKPVAHVQKAVQAMFSGKPKKHVTVEKRELTTREKIENLREERQSAPREFWEV